MAAGVPLVMFVRLVLASVGREPDLVKAISRSGGDKEASGGPLLYVAVLLTMTLAFWRSTVVGLLAISQMAAGDGLADIVGRKFGAAKWPWSSSKSYAGSFAFVAGGFTVSIALVYWMVSFSCLDLHGLAFTDVALRIALVSLGSALVELVPFGDDNITVPAAAAVFAAILFGECGGLSDGGNVAGWLSNSI